MTKDEMIDFLQKLVKDLQARLDAANGRIATLEKQLGEALAMLGSIKESVEKKDEDLATEKRKNKGLSSLLHKENEKQVDKPQLTEEEQKVLDEARAIKRKQRGNNGAKHDKHPELKTIYHDVYPGDPGFNLQLAKELTTRDENGNIVYREHTKIIYVPGHYEKHVYRIHKYVQNGRNYEGVAPVSTFLNSHYDASVISFMMYMRYIMGMSMERVINYSKDQGFNLRKPTAHYLLKLAAQALMNFYKAIRKAVLGDDYIACDETYYTILVPEKNSKGKGERKGYFWVIIGYQSKMVYVVYEDGSRSGEVIFKQLKDYKGTMQSDAASFYKTIEGKEYPNIVRIACLQHIKRRFLDLKDSEPDAAKMVRLINKLYQEEHKHKIGVDGWTADENLKWRAEYSPGILKEIRGHLDKILNTQDLLPKSELAQAAFYMDKEWGAVKDIFKRGDTHLDNNYVEILNRFFSLSRRNSLFFGSHKGAERSAVLYTLALSAKINHLNLFEYITDVINKTCQWQPNTPLEKYLPLLPNVWKKEENPSEK